MVFDLKFCLFFIVFLLVNLELVIRNYFGGFLDFFFLDEEVMVVEYKDLVFLNVLWISFFDLEVIYGVEVEEFIISECRIFDIWNEKWFENFKFFKVCD